MATRAEVMGLLGIDEAAANAECHCGHPRWEHATISSGVCLHADYVGDWGEYNEWCRCNRFVDNDPREVDA